MYILSYWEVTNMEINKYSKFREKYVDGWIKCTYLFKKHPVITYFMILMFIGPCIILIVE